jgi:hypothetical protein
MFGSERIVMEHIPQVHSSCPCAVTSALELHSSFVCIFEKGGTMKRKNLALLLLGCVLVTPLHAQIKHIEMRVEGIT